MGTSLEVFVWLSWEQPRVVEIPWKSEEITNTPGGIFLDGFK